MNGISSGSSPYDVVGASEGPSIGNINPDAQSLVLRALAAHIDKVTAIIADKNAPIEQVQFEVDAANIPGGGLTYHLPSGGAVVGYYLENNSANTISIYAGNSGASRALATAPGQTYKSSPIPQQITSVALVSSGVSVGLVRLLISSQNLGPAFGSLTGVAAPPPSTTSTFYGNVVPAGTALQILAANPNRVGAMITNNSNATINLAFGFPASLTQFSVAMFSYGTYNLPLNFRGYVSAYNTSGNPANVNATEYTP